MSDVDATKEIAGEYQARYIRCLRSISTAADAERIIVESGQGSSLRQLTQVWAHVIEARGLFESARMAHEVALERQEAADWRARVVGP